MTRIISADPMERALTKLREDADKLGAHVNQQIIDNVHLLIAGKQGTQAIASLAAVMADVLGLLSSSEEGLNRNLLVVSELVLKIAGPHVRHKSEPAPEPSQNPGLIAGTQH